MQTNFTEKQLENPRNKAADEIIRKCVHCGLCTASCSSYVLTGDERDSPRGRIYMIKDMFERDVKPDAEVTKHLDRCLSCLSCMTACPSHVDYMHLIDLARPFLEQHNKRPVRQQMLRNFLARLMPDPVLFGTVLNLAVSTRPLHKLFKTLAAKLGIPEAVTMLEMVPKHIPSGGKLSAPGVHRAKGRQLARVALLPGCVQKVLRPSINDAAVRIMTAHGVEVVVPRGAGCCGALEHHLGRKPRAIKQAKRTVDAISEVLRHHTLDAIVITASGCGTQVKDYGHLLKDEPGYAKRAEKVAGLARDISEILDGLELTAPVQWNDLKVAYHSACSMQHGQQLHHEPYEILKQAGYDVVHIPESHLCCGSAGVYNILQPDIARGLRDRKVKNILSVAPDIVATGNIGCMTQLQPVLDVPVVHTVELVDWSIGGPCPDELKHLEVRTHKVSDL